MILKEHITIVILSKNINCEYIIGRGSYAL